MTAKGESSSSILCFEISIRSRSIWAVRASLETRFFGDIREMVATRLEECLRSLRPAQRQGYVGCHIHIFLPSLTGPQGNDTKGAAQNVA